MRRPHPRGADAAVVVRRPAPDDARLSAFVVPAQMDASEVAQLRGYTAERLPAHMVPNDWHVLAELPLTAHGKLDRRALSEQPPSALDAPEAPDLSPFEQVVARVWSKALGCEVSDAGADFLGLGGHSMMALAIIDDLHQDLGVELSLADFLTAQTLSGVAELVEDSLRSRPELVR